MRTYHITGTCHIDLAWHGDETMYACYLEQFTVVLLDLMEQYPEMTYVIEQAYHYRGLEKRRPDLVRRLRALVQSGRIEVVGGMASTMDSNMPCAESLIRNQLLGLGWFQQHLDADVQTGWLVDAFGSHAQIPQIMHSFGIQNIMATRFGGRKAHDVFFSRGLNGDLLLTAGRDCFSPNLPGPEDSRVFFEFVQTGQQIDEAYERIKATQLSGPVLADIYVEDETYPNSRIASGAYDLIRYAESNGDRAFFSSFRDFFHHLREIRGTYPVEDADLNPEFTGTYANRVEIKQENRKTETALMKAEKWLALLGKSRSEALHDSWWDMAFVHFHDVFTGSTPDCVYQDVLERLHTIQDFAANTLQTLFTSRDGGNALQVVNSLPFERTAWISVPCPSETEVEVAGTASYCSHGKLWFLAQLPPCGSRVYHLAEKQNPGTCPAEPDSACAVLENETLRLQVDASHGVSLYHKASARFLLREAKDLLVLQNEEGNFQIENICGPEQAAWSRPVTVQQSDPFQISVSGSFILEKECAAQWEMSFSLRPGDTSLGLQIQVHWTAEGKRLRLKLNTELLETGSCICEIPFGAVRRSTYAPGFCQKGEWPVQRFSLLEDTKGGLALINTGVPGVEVTGSSLYTTLLRSPVAVYAGMIPDATSSQHGIHVFTFSLYPYSGAWQDSDVLRLAQEWNDPLSVFPCDEHHEPLESLLSVSESSVLLHAVKHPENTEDQNEIILRLAEQTGRETDCRLRLRNACRAWRTNLKEEKEEEIPVQDSTLQIHLSPWQICTLCVQRTGNE